MTCKTCGEVKSDDKYLNCEQCREIEAEKRRERYAIQQYKINPYFEPRNEKMDGMTKTERASQFKQRVTAAMKSCPNRSTHSPDYVTYCGLCGTETLERYLFKCLCKRCRYTINGNYALYEEGGDKVQSTPLG